MKCKTPKQNSEKEFHHYLNIAYCPDQVGFFFFAGLYRCQALLILYIILSEQAGIKIARRTINNLRCADVTTVMAESEEELKSLLMKVKEESKSQMLVAQLCPTLCDSMDLAHQVSLSIEFSRQEYWSGLPLPSPGDLPDPGIKCVSSTLQTDSLLYEPPENIQNMKIMSSGPITSWQIDGETVET